MMRRLLPMALLANALVVPLSRPAAAGDCPSGSGRVTDNYLSANVCVPGQGAASPGPSSNASPAGGGGSGSSGSSEPSPYRWNRTYLDDPRPSGSFGGNPCWNTDAAGNRTPAAGTQPGRPYEESLTDTRTGQIISGGSGCETPGQAAAGGAPPPPPPPTPGEVIQRAPMPRVPFVLSPSGKDCSVAGASALPANPAPPCAHGEAPGLTGLETLLWVEPPPPPEVSVTVDIRGYSVTTRARPVTYRWSMRQDGDTPSTRNPNPTFTTDTPGTRDAPAARYRWETKGDYRIGLAVVWEGSYTFSGFGISRTEALGQVTGPTTVIPYHVIEVRAVPTGVDR